MKVFSMSNAMDGLPTEIHIVPIGEWKERGFRITEADCDDIIRNFQSFGIKLVVDYNHQSLKCDGNGVPAPAAGFIGKLEKRENGVWGVDIEWTDEAKKYIENKQYRYISPVICFDDRDPHTDKWIGCSLHSVALTNTPYFRDDLEPIINSRYNSTHPAGAMADHADEDAGRRKETKPAQAGAKDKETNMTLEEQIAALEANKQAQATRIAELEGQIAAKDANLEVIAQVKLVDDAIAAKKLLPAQKEVGLMMAKQGKEQFDKFIACNVIPDLSKTTEIAADQGGDGAVTYDVLLADAKKMEQFKKDNPAQFEALRKTFYKGE